MVNVRISVFNSIGEEIAVLVNETKEPGHYEIQWNASKLSSGTYFCNITAGNFTDTKKMILMK